MNPQHRPVEAFSEEGEAIKLRDYLRDFFKLTSKKFTAYKARIEEVNG